MSSKRLKHLLRTSVYEYFLNYHSATVMETSNDGNVMCKNENLTHLSQNKHQKKQLQTSRQLIIVIVTKINLNI